MIKYFLALQILVKWKITESTPCDGLVFRNEYYDKHILFEGLGRPNNLVMHKPSGNLFFSHTIQNGSDVDFGIMVCHIERKMCRDVPGIPGGYAITWDRGNNLIFFGGHDGIYVYDFLTNSVKFFAERGISIWGLFVRRNFYYIRYPSQKLYVFKRAKFTPVSEASDIEIDNFFVTQQFAIYYSNKTGLYKVRKPRLKPFILKLGINVRQITYDVYGDIYFGASDGIYMAEKRRQKIRKIANVENMFGMTFHKAGNSEKTRRKNYEIIYSDKDTIYLLLPSKRAQICINATSVPNNQERRIRRRRSISF